jgi:hypothetical protein
MVFPFRGFSEISEDKPEHADLDERHEAHELAVSDGTENS